MSAIFFERCNCDEETSKAAAEAQNLFIYNCKWVNAAVWDQSSFVVHASSLILKSRVSRRRRRKKRKKNKLQVAVLCNSFSLPFVALSLSPSFSFELNGRHEEFDVIYKKKSSDCSNDKKNIFMWNLYSAW